MSVPLPFLAQSIQLYPGEVEALRDGLANFINGLLFSSNRLSAEQAYAIKPLAKVHRRLLSLVRAQLVRPAKMRKLRIEFDEMVALRRQNGELQAAGGHELQLVAALGKMHQKSLSLDQHIKFECP